MSQLAVMPEHDGHDRWDADHVSFKDALKAGGVVLDPIHLNVPIPDFIFSKAALKK